MHSLKTSSLMTAASDLAMKINVTESILDDPKENLCPEVWNIVSKPPKLLDDV